VLGLSEGELEVLGDKLNEVEEDSLGLLLGLSLELGDNEGELLGDTELEGERLGLLEADGLREGELLELADGELDGDSDGDLDGDSELEGDKEGELEVEGLVEAIT
jgi:hypothetical protein